MRIRIIDTDTDERWIYNINYDLICKSINRYEYIHMYDSEFLDVISINMAIQYFFGVRCYFVRDENIHDYISGKIMRNNKPINNVILFFED